MALFESGNPTLSEKIFRRSATDASTDVMTVQGTIKKFGFLLLMVLASASFTWKYYYDQVLVETAISSIMPFMWTGLIGGFICALVIIFKPNLSPYLAPIYALLEGLLIGALSAVINEEFAIKYPGLVLQAVGMTFGIAIAVFFLYNFRIIKATEKFKSVMISAISGVFIFYLIYWGLKIFGINMPFMSWNDTSLLGIGINIVVIIIAALTLILDFDMIEKGAENNAPKFMEWYGSFGLLVTLVWLYIQILKLLSRLASSRN